MSLLPGSGSSLDELDLADRRTDDALARLGSCLGWPLGNPHDAACVGRFDERLDNGHILQTFESRGFRLAVAQDAIGEIQQLSSELIVLLSTHPGCALADGQCRAEGHRVL